MRSSCGTGWTRPPRAIGPLRRDVGSGLEPSKPGATPKRYRVRGEVIKSKMIWPICLASSGGNTASGNASSNTAGVLQGALTPNGLASNAASATTGSSGLAVISTGKAEAIGSRGNSSIQQAVAAGDADPPVDPLAPVQVAVVANLGVGVAISGENEATGNRSSSNVQVDQVAAVAAPGARPVPGCPRFHAGARRDCPPAA